MTIASPSWETTCCPRLRATYHGGSMWDDGAADRIARRWRQALTSPSFWRERETYHRELTKTRAGTKPPGSALKCVAGSTKTCSLHVKAPGRVVEAIGAPRSEVVYFESWRRAAIRMSRGQSLRFYEIELRETGTPEQSLSFYAWNVSGAFRIVRRLEGAAASAAWETFSV